MDRVWWRKHRRVVCGAGVALAIVLALAAKPALVGYHRWRMGYCLRTAAWLGPYGYRQRDYLDGYAKCRAKLVTLGYFEERHFDLKHVQAGTEAFAELWRQLREAFPDYPHVEMERPAAPRPARIAVWDRPKRMHLWEDFMASHDTPGFAQRFAAPPGGPAEAPAVPRGEE